MNWQKKSLLTVFSILMVLALLLTSCQSAPVEPQEATTASESSEEVTATSEEGSDVVVSTGSPEIFMDPETTVRVALIRRVGEGGFMERYLAGAQSMADALGIELIETNSRGDNAKMVTAIETAIQQRVDAIIVDHGQTDTVQPVIEQALAAGIKVLTFDTVINNPDVPEIEQDDLLIGFMLSKQLATDFGGEADVVYANVGGYAPLDKRDRQWQSLKWRYEGLNEVAQIGAVTDNTAADTMTRMEATLKENPEIDAVVAMWDEFAKGVVRAISQAGKSEDIKVYSVDITNEDIGLMVEENSPWAATVATDSYNVGRLAVRAAAAMIAGEPMDKYLLVEPSLITRDFLLENDITNMDQLVDAMPSLGESPLVWPTWMSEVMEANGAEVPAVAISGGAAGEAICADAGDVELPAVLTGDDPIRVALIRRVGEGGFMERYLAGAEAMAAELGVELIETNSRGDNAKMVTAIETAIQQEVDAIIVDHGQTDTVQPVIEQAMEAGIKVLTFDTVINNPDVPEIEQDDLLIGFMLSKKLAIDFGGEADVVYANVGGYAPLDKRDRQWQNLKWRYEGLNEVAQIGAVTDNTAADTMTRMEATLKENPEVDAVIAMWDEFAKGVVRAISQAGKSDQIKVYSVDITNEDIGLMIEENSPWAATVATDSYNVGRLAVRAAVAMVAGEDVNKYLLVSPTLITRDFLIENDITNMDQLVEAMPSLGESPLVWPDWMCKLSGK
jgi:simple sugar transport system substrate-binding protein